MDSKNLRVFEDQLIRLGFLEIPVDIGFGKMAFLSIVEADKSENQRLRFCFKHTGIRESLRYAEMGKRYEEKKMKLIDKTLDRLTKVLLAKGYKGPYNIEGYHTETIPDLLIKYCDEALKDPMKVSFPFVVSTYTKYNNDDTGYIRCFFTIDYIEKKGLDITHMKAMSCDRDHNVIEEWKRPISSSMDIPPKEQINKKVMPKAYQHKKNKGIRN